MSGRLYLRVEPGEQDALWFDWSFWVGLYAGSALARRAEIPGPLRRPRRGPIFRAMERQHTTPEPVRPADPPPGSGIEVQPGDDGVRITLPRLYSTGDILTTVLAGAIAVWIAVWLDSMAPGRGVSALGRTLMAGVGLFFAALAVSQAWPILARRVLEDRGDVLALGRKLGVRTLFLRTIPTADITSVDRLPEPGLNAVDAPYVTIRTADDEIRIGKHLGEDELAWLEGALREVVGWEPPS